MSTRVFKFDGDGHRPRVSPQGDLVGWGDTYLQVVHVANPNAIWRVGEGRHLRFLSNRRITWLRNLTNSTADLYWDDLEFFSGGIKDEALDPSLVAGNDFEAADDNWASVLISSRRLTFNGHEMTRGVRAVRMCGRFMVTIEQGPKSELFRVYENGVFVREHTLPATANEYRVSEQGWISFGYYGPSHVMTPDGNVHLINVVPEEFVARIIHLPDGSVWAWTSSVVNGNPLVLGRPLLCKVSSGSAFPQWISEDECAQLQFPAEGVDAQWWPERQSFTVAGAANLGHTAPLEVHVVPLTHPRTKIITSEPPPVEENVNKPGIDVKDYAKTIHSGANTLIAYWKDRNNPGHEFRVLILNGSLKVEMTYDGWKTKSDYTGSVRPVTIKC